MKVKQGDTTVIKNTKDTIQLFLEKVSKELPTYKNRNLILDISKINEVTLQEIKLFSEVSKAHKKVKKSFVLVASGVDFNAVPSQLTVVPSVQEAHDIIEMEEIERDLGF